MDPEMIVKIVYNLQDVPRQGSVFIFGAGSGGVMLKRKLERYYGFCVDGFIDSFKTGVIDGVPVYETGKFFDSAPKDTHIVITSQSYREIADRCVRAGFAQVYNAFPYVVKYVNESEAEAALPVDAALAERLRAAGVAVETLFAFEALDRTALAAILRNAGPPVWLILIDALINAAFPRGGDTDGLDGVLDVICRQMTADATPPAAAECVTEEDAVLRFLVGGREGIVDCRRWLNGHPDHRAAVDAALRRYPSLHRAIKARGRAEGILSSETASFAAFQTNSYRRHTETWEAMAGDPERDRIHRAWFDENSANSALQRPLYDLVSHLRESGTESWLTVGDGRFGLDAVNLMRRGFTDVLATDISVAHFNQLGPFEHSLPYQAENAEALSFSTDSFDYVFCKEAYHHFPRPMLALYEMIRVARRGVVLIEPQDGLIDPPVMVQYARQNNYETSGNYAYTISRREIEKVALGLNFSVIAFKGFMTAYIRGQEFAPADLTSPIYLRLMAELCQQEAACRAGSAKPPLLAAILFKREPAPAVTDALGSDAWEVRRLSRNPYI